MSTPELSCEEVIERLFEYLDRELDTVSQHEIDRHLERCYDCFSRAEFERRIRERIAATGSQRAPDRLRKRIRELTGHQRDPGLGRVDPPGQQDTGQYYQ